MRDAGQKISCGKRQTAPQKHRKEREEEGKSTEVARDTEHPVGQAMLEPVSVPGSKKPGLQLLTDCKERSGASQERKLALYACHALFCKRKGGKQPLPPRL